MRYSLHPPPRRGGFTLVEMMVSTALIIFIMYIMATAFEKGLESFRMMKVAGDMQEKLRTASVAIRSDLNKPHFNDKGSSLGEYLSDAALDPTQLNWTPPTKGYFRINFGKGALEDVADEGFDPDDTQLARTRRLPWKPNAATDLYPSMQFTVRLSGERRDQFFTTRHNVTGLNNWNTPNYTVSEDPTVFTSTWADVSYFVLPLLDDRGQPVTTPGGAQLYALYRRVKLLYDPAPGTVPPVVVAPGDPNFAGLSFWRRSNGGGRAELNTPSSVTAPIRRFGADQNTFAGLQVYGALAGDTSLAPSKDVYGPASDVAGTDLLLANVTDFEIKAQWDVPKAADLAVFAPFYAALAAQMAVRAGTAVDYPFDVPPSVNPHQQTFSVFDTWSSQEDTTGPSPAYSYGRPIVSSASGTGVVLQTGPGPNRTTGRYDANNRNLANWNAGHFVTHVDKNLEKESMPLRVRIKAVQIKIRIWDQKSQQSRQITLVQDL